MDGTCSSVGGDKKYGAYFDLGINFKATALKEGKGLRPKTYLVFVGCKEGIYMEVDDSVH